MANNQGPQNMMWRIGIPLHSPLYSASMRSFPVEPEHPLVRNWRPLRNDIEATMKRMGVPWCALEVFRRRHTLERSEEDDTTVLITVRQQDTRQWEVLQSTVRGLCLAHGQPTLNVELIEGSVHRFGSGLDLAYESRPPMGSSLGTQGYDGSGTLGGYVRLRSSSKDDLWCALTCHHVVCPNSILNGKEITSFPDPITKPDEALKVEQPSHNDNSETLEVLTTHIESVKGRIHNYQTEREMGIWNEVRSLGLERALETLAQYEDLLTTASKFDRSFGHVWATSGYRVADQGCSLDWGLVHMHADRKGYNTIGSMPSLPENVTKGLVGGVVENTATLGLGQEVVQFGKASKARHGVFSAIESRVKWPDLSQITTEWAFLGRGQTAFAAPGDSGAFVLTLQGTLGGLLIGGPVGEGHDGVGYVTPIAEVWSDIKARTGYEVCLA